MLIGNGGRSSAFEMYVGGNSTNASGGATGIGSGFDDVGNIAENTIALPSGWSTDSSGPQNIYYSPDSKAFYSLLEVERFVKGVSSSSASSNTTSSSSSSSSSPTNIVSFPAILSKKEQEKFDRRPMFNFYHTKTKKTGTNCRSKFNVKNQQQQDFNKV